MKVVPGMVIREVADEILLIPTGELSSRYNGLITVNEVSALVWRKLETGCTFEELLQAIQEEFEVSEEVAKKDLEKLLGKLEEMELLEKE